MLITHVDLVNFKSYTDEHITFQPGTNAIIGSNGAGKSTILEAIGFVLFDHRGAGLASRLREGADSGRVVVGLVSSFDERAYEVERRFSERTTQRYRVFDLELEQVIAEGNEEVQAWIHEHLRIEPTAVLDTLFENTIGVPQGTFTAPFLMPATQRKGVFDPLLQVDDYRKASDRLRDTVHHLGEQSGALEIEIARLEERLRALPRLVEEATAEEGSLLTLISRHMTLSTGFRTATATLETLDAAEARARLAEAEWQRARAAMEGQTRLLQAAREAVSEAEAARDVVARALPGHEAYVREERRLEALETRRAARDRLRQEQARADQARARTAERLAGLTTALDGVTDAEQSLAALAPLVARQDALEAALASAEQAARDLLVAQRRESEAAGELRRAETERTTLNARLAEGAKLDAQLAGVQARREEAVARERTAREDHATAQAEKGRLERQSGALSDPELARCPVCEGELTPAHRAELLARNKDEVTTLARRIQACAAALNDSTRAIKACEREANALQQRLRALPTADDATRAEAEEARRREALGARRAEVQALDSAPERVAALRDEVATLGDPRREQQRCEDQVAQRERLEADLAAAREADAAAEQQLTALAEGLRAHEGLDAALAEAQAARSSHRADHDAYLGHEATARQYETRCRRETEVGAELAERETEAERLADEHRAALAAYDPAAHSRTRSEVDSLRQELARCRAQLEERRARLDTVAREIAALTVDKGKLADARDRATALTELTRTVETVREWLRLAGPYVTQQLVLQISREASAFYGDIMADHSGRLQWSEDYEVALEIKGQRRRFRQFSGGEQMIAALAVRLALLREISAVDVAFFDEPTAHLDPERR
ncbi:MAG: AAA family ATPase, partial [Gaiellaceae bacterium]